jgi:hypothetical protein
MAPRQPHRTAGLLHRHVAEPWYRGAVNCEVDDTPNSVAKSDNTGIRMQHRKSSSPNNPLLMPQSTVHRQVVAIELGQVDAGENELIERG